MTDGDLIAEFLALPRYAVVGVSADHVGALLAAPSPLGGASPTPTRTIFTVNPRYDEIEGEQCVALGLTRVWLQPGAESEEAIRFCQEKGIQVLYGVCVMAESWRENSS